MTAIYKCFQSNGVVLYSDAPCEGTKIESIALKEVPVAEVLPSSQIFPISSLVLVLLVYCVMSLLCFLVYWWDKRRAIQRERRIPEKTLHLLELLGGWPGGFIAQRTLRHKNRKSSYQVKFWFIVILHVLVWLDFYFDHVLWNLFKPFVSP